MRTTLALHHNEARQQPAFREGR